MLLRGILRVARWVLWLVLVAILYCTGFGLIQTTLASAYRGDFSLTGKPAQILTFVVEEREILGIPISGFVQLLVIAGVAALIANAVSPWAATLRKRREGLPWVLAILILALGVSVLSLIGLVKSSVDLQRMRDLNFEGENTHSTLFGITVPPADSLWLTLFVALFVVVYASVLAYNVQVRHAGRGWRDYQVLSLPPAEALAKIPDSTVSDWQRDLFIGMLMEPARYFERIKDLPEATQRSTTVTTRSTINVGQVPIRDTTVLVPIFLASRSRLEDGLKVTVGEDHASTLNHVETAAHVGRILRSLMRDAGRRTLSAYQAPSPSGGPSLEGRAMQYLTAANDWSILDQRARTRNYGDFARFGAEILDLPHTKESPLYQAVKLLSELLRSYPIVVELDRTKDFDDRRRGRVVRVTTVRRVIAPHTEYRFSDIRAYVRGAKVTSFAAAWVRFFRIFEGLRYAIGRFVVVVRHIAGIGSDVVRHPLANAARTPSYHLELKGPEHTYMARQAIGPRLRADPERPRHAISAHAAGQRHTHLYIRNGPAYFKSMSYSATFLERTPGSLAVAFIAAASSFVVSTILAIRQLDAIHLASAKQVDAGATILSDFEIAATVPDQSGLLQILLSFPIVAIASSTVLAGRAPWGGSLPARIANLGTVVLSVAALWFSSLPATVDELARPRVWLIVLGGLAFISVACLASWITRTLVHSRFVDEL
jgi:hypothetical protein